MKSMIGKPAEKPEPKKAKKPRYSLVMGDHAKGIFQIWDGGDPFPAHMRACVQLHGTIDSANAKMWADFIVNSMNEAVHLSKLDEQGDKNEGKEWTE